MQLWHLLLAVLLVVVLLVATPLLREQPSPLVPS
jgi:hypothetical protein